MIGVTNLAARDRGPVLLYCGRFGTRVCLPLLVSLLAACGPSAPSGQGGSIVTAPTALIAPTNVASGKANVLTATTTSVMPAAGSVRLTTNSMEPTLAAGSVVTYRPLSSPPSRGQIVLYRRLNTLVVGRVVAVPGDNVEVRDGQLILNGQPVAEPYISEPMRYTVAARQLEARQYDVLGDNRNNAADSHITGPIAEDRLVGLVS